MHRYIFNTVKHIFVDLKKTLLFLATSLNNFPIFVTKIKCTEKNWSHKCANCIGYDFLTLHMYKRTV